MTKPERAQISLGWQANAPRDTPECRLAATAVTLVFLLAACGGDAASPTGPDNPQSVASVEITPATDSILLGGGTGLRARITDAAGNTIRNANVVWASSDTTVVRIHANPLDGAAGAIGVGGGSATITATAGGTFGQATVTVIALEFTSVSAGTFFSCGLTTDGVTYCWGATADGLLGVGESEEICPGFSDSPCTTKPMALLGGRSFASVTTGKNGFFCGLTVGGEAYCWGFNGRGQLGDGSTTSRTTPTRVSGDLVFEAIDLGGQHACGLTTDGAAYCWGENRFGQLGATSASVTETCDTGTDSVPCSTTPMPVSGGHRFSSVSVGGNHVCGIGTPGTVYCWGQNSAGQLGNGVMTGDDPNPTPVTVSGGHSFVSVTTGSFYTCGTTTDATTLCWGDNGYGQLGIGHTNGSLLPVPVAGGEPFVSVAAFADHTCGVTARGNVYCWGNNFDGQLGDGSETDNSTVPVPVAGGLEFASVDPGWFHTCGMTTSGTAYCWGANDSGQIGNGRSNEQGSGSLTPVRVFGQR